jgi:hypothetical protein
MSNSSVNNNTAANDRTHHTHNDARLNNIVIFGVNENRDPLIWRAEIEDILIHVVGHAVHINDVFRLGAYRDERSRPVLVKLNSAWDRRLVLSGCWKLKDYNSGRVFIRPDEPLDIRRQQTMTRLKQKAEREGKTVSVDGGVLCIDDIVVFSLSDGFVKDDNNRGISNNNNNNERLQGRHR